MSRRTLRPGRSIFTALAVGQRITWRNGRRERLLTTQAGNLDLKIPKVRTGSFFPSLLERRRRIDQALFAVVMEANVHGVSTRSVDDLVKTLGADTGISKSEVSRICGEPDAELTPFKEASREISATGHREILGHKGPPLERCREWERSATASRSRSGRSSCAPYEPAAWTTSSRSSATVLVRMLREHIKHIEHIEHIERFGVAPDGRVFRKGRAREAALTLDELALQDLDAIPGSPDRVGSPIDVVTSLACDRPGPLLIPAPQPARPACPNLNCEHRRHPHGAQREKPLDPCMAYAM
ncbi:hypothetical protein SCANM124S_08837 [Streptomyces canus]